MTLFLSGTDVAELSNDELVLRAARRAVESEGADDTVVPPRIDVPTSAGFLRVMPAAMGDVMGLKVMTLVEGLGTRYLLLVHSTASGELVGVLDAEEVTRLRTAAITALAAGILQPEPPRELGLIGTGFEAEGHLRLLARLWPVETVSVYSRSSARREEFARSLSAELGVRIVPAPSAAEAVGAAATTVLATKSREPVVDGDDFPRRAVVLSIGSTRPDLRELDRRSFERAAAVLVDDPEQVSLESGDVIEATATGAIESRRLVSMGSGRSNGDLLRREDGRDLLLFKSVGTAIQDLSLARAALEAAREAGRGRELGELTRLKPFAEALKQAAEAGVGDSSG